MKVSELMNTNVVSIAPEDTASHAACLLARHNIGALPVCTPDGRLRGMVTDRDIVLRCVASESPPEETMARELMTRGVTTISPHEDIREAARLMSEEQVRRLPVVDAGRVVGMLSLGDMARCHAYDMEASKALADICESNKRF
ncbi:MAG: CBS domain-containing protein [Clostridia bacterium]